MGAERQRTVYVAHDGATLRREGERLQVFVRRERTAEIPVVGLGQLVLMGNVTLTPAALDLIVDRGVDTVLLGHHGRYRGRIVSGLSGNVRLRLAQYEFVSNPSRSLDLARRIVAGKVGNQRALLLRHARRHGPTATLRTAAIGLRAAAARVESAATLEEARGCEGSGSAAYFRVFGELLRSTYLRFDGRSRRPPLDPVNALLSLGYTLLSNVVEACVQLVGLDPYLGTLHAPLGGRPSLVCDLVEEFRAPVVDALVVAAVNHGAFDADGFEEAGPGEPVIMKRETVRWLITLFERRMCKATLYQPVNKRLVWRDVIEQQVRLVARHVLGAETYRAHALR